MIPILDPNALINIPYPRVNCLKIIPFKAAHSYIAHIWQYPPPQSHWIAQLVSGKVIHCIVVFSDG